MSSAMGAAWGAVDTAWPFVVLIGTAVLFVVACRVILRLAERHRDAEPRATVKAGIAIAASLLLGLGGLAALGGLGSLGVHGFEQYAREGMHDTLLKNLNRTIGEADYQEAVKTTQTKPAVLAGLQAKLAGQNATLADAQQTVAVNTAALAGMNATDPRAAAANANITAARDQIATTSKERSETWGGVNQTAKDIADAHVRVRQWTPNHLVWLQAEPLIKAHRDDEAEAIIVKAADKATITQLSFLPPLGEVGSPCTRTVEGYCKDPATAIELQHTYTDLHGHSVPFAEDGPRVFENQREFNHQMKAQMNWFVYPGVTGLFLAPFAFAGGHILGKAYEASTGVGYKRYPGKAAGFFLLFMGLFGVLTVAVTTGALASATGGIIPKFWNLPPMLDIFGILAIPFSAVVLRDLHKRSIEGQIAL